MWIRCNARSVPISIVQCYAPTDCSDAKAKDALYPQLAWILDEIPRRDHLVMMDDFNVRVGSDHKTWSNTLGKYGIEEKESDNGLRLLNLCTSNDLCVLGIYFQHKRIHM